MAAHAAGPVFFLDDFAARQWDDEAYSGTRISYDKEAFVQEVHRQHRNVRSALARGLCPNNAHLKRTSSIQASSVQGASLVSGYAPFCKHLFIPNFVGARLGALRITEQNRGRLQCGYSQRRPEELAVLTRQAVLLVGEATSHHACMPPLM
jgi:hypothetical protein